MLTPRRIVMAARLVFVMASLGMAVLMLGPFQGLEQMFGLDDKAAHAVAFYGVASGLFLIAPNQRRDDLALYVIAAAFGAELLQALTGRSVSVIDFLAGAAGVAAAWAPWSYERLATASGYRAGVLSPEWYDTLWNHEGRVAARWLARAAALLREEDLDASPASVIEAAREAGRRCNATSAASTSPSSTLVPTRR